MGFSPLLTHLLRRSLPPDLQAKQKRPSLPNLFRDLRFSEPTRLLCPWLLRAGIAPLPAGGEAFGQGRSQHRLHPQPGGASPAPGAAPPGRPLAAAAAAPGPAPRPRRGPRSPGPAVPGPRPASRPPRARHASGGGAPAAARSRGQAAGQGGSRRRRGSAPPPRLGLGCAGRRCGTAGRARRGPAGGSRGPPGAEAGGGRGAAGALQGAGVLPARPPAGAAPPDPAEPLRCLRHGRSRAPPRLRAAWPRLGTSARLSRAFISGKPRYCSGESLSLGN